MRDGERGEITFFDSSCTLGRRLRWDSESFWSKERLLEEMRYYGIARALVVSSVAKEQDVLSGNEWLLGELRDCPSLEGCWVLLPDKSLGMEDVSAVVERMLASGIRAAKLYPRQYLHSMAVWSIGHMLESLAAHSIPLFIEVGTEFPVGDLMFEAEIFEICSQFPELPVVLSRVPIFANRKLYPLLEKCPNLRFEISGFWNYKGTETVCRMFGPHRMLFGTYLPVQDPGGPLAMVLFADISDGDRRMIAGGNLESLLEGVKR